MKKKKTEVLEPMEKSARRISEELEILSVHQQYMRSRELRHLWSNFYNFFFGGFPTHFQFLSIKLNKVPILESFGLQF